MYFEHKHVETGPSSSHELATFLKYEMPLRIYDPKANLILHSLFIESQCNLWFYQRILIP